jgi:hypothetical protein
MMEFGLGKVCITPKFGTKLIGQVKQLEADGKYTDLFARSLFLRSTLDNLIIVSCDLLFLPTDVVYGLRKEISGQTGVDFEKIIIHTTHTHAGPSVVSLFNEDNVHPDVTYMIYNGIVSSAIQAFTRRKKGKIGIGKDYAYGLAFNRRYRMKDGTVETHPHKDDPNIFEAEGPNDPEVNVLVLKDENNLPVGAVANFSCHLTSLERNNTKYSADFPAFAEQKLAKHYGNQNFVMIYLNGPCGNICQVNVEDKNAVEVGIVHTKKMGKKFADSVRKTIENCEILKGDFTIKVLYREIKIPIRKITNSMLYKASKTIKQFEGRRFKALKVSNYGIESYRDTSVISANKLLETDFWKNIAAKELIALYEKYKNNNLETVPLTVARMEDALLIANPAELFVEYSLALKRRFYERYHSVFVVELANGWVGYVPTKEAFIPEVGGYEVQFLNSSKLCEDAGDIIIKEIIEMEKTLAQK